MKRAITFVLLLAIGILPVIAQINFGVDAGFGTNDIMSSNMYTREKSSYKLGAFINSPLFDKNKKDVWETGIYYQRKGMKMNNFLESSTNYIQYMDVSMDYIQVPLMVGYKYNFSPSFSVALKTGLYVAYAFDGSGNLTGMDMDGRRFNAQMDIFSSNPLEELGSSYPVKAFKRFDAGSLFSLDFGLFNDKLLLRFSFEKGWKNIASYDSEMQHNTQYISVGYNFK